MKKIIIYFPDTAGCNFTPPYEILFQAKALENLPVEIIIADHRIDDIKKVIREYHKETILFIISSLYKYWCTSIIRQNIDGFKMAEFVKEEYNLPVLWIGNSATMLGKSILNKPFVDFIIYNGNEKSLSQFVSAFISNTNLKEIKNLSYKEHNQIITNPREHDNSFELFGDFDLSLLKIENYIHNNTLNYVASTGCINNCSFCFVPIANSRRWHHNSIDNITKQLISLLSSYPQITNVHFRDDNFLVNKNFITGLFSTLSKEKNKFTWSAQTSVNVLKKYNHNDIRNLKNWGCGNISIGIESGDEYILKKVTKSKTSRKLSIETIKKLIQEGISVSITCVIYFPYNNGRDFNRTLRFLMKLKFIYPKLSINCTILMPIPGTEIFAEIYGNDEFDEERIYDIGSWVNKRKFEKLKKFENFYFIFNEIDFYKKIPCEIAKELKWINLIFYPFIKLRFLTGYTSFLWEYAITKKKIKKIKAKFDIVENPFLTNVGIRQLTSNFNYGFSKKS